MSVPKQKKTLIGYALLVKRHTGWERVEPTFSSKYAANEYRERRFPEAKDWKVEGVRFNCLALTGKEV